MARIDDILERFNVTYDELSEDERTVANNWLKQLQTNPITVESIKDMVEKLKQQVEAELASPNLDKNQDLFLKARLRNLMLLEGMITAPEKAKKALENYIKNG